MHFCRTLPKTKTQNDRRPFCVCSVSAAGVSLILRGGVQQGEQGQRIGAVIDQHALSAGEGIRADVFVNGQASDLNAGFLIVEVDDGG